MKFSVKFYSFKYLGFTIHSNKNEDNLEFKNTQEYVLVMLQCGQTAAGTMWATLPSIEYIISSEQSKTDEKFSVREYSFKNYITYYYFSIFLWYYYGDF